MIYACLMSKQIPKPLIERKRRARINKSLLQLQSILSEVVAQVRHYSSVIKVINHFLMKNLCHQVPNRKSGKVEKADVLEVTVNHLKSLKATKDQGKL